MKHIDLNCDLGEGAGNDAAIMPLISSANIACCGHTGDELSMLTCVRLAVQHGVAIGAHPSYPDRANFGRVELDMSIDGLIESLVHQISSLQAVCASEGAELRHVKPHGALYNASAARREVADAVASAVAMVFPQAVLFGLAGSESLDSGRRAGLCVASEAFADRTYQPDGRLTPRKQAGAQIDDVQHCLRQVKQMITMKSVLAVDGSTVPIVAETVCLHGDSPNAVELAQALRHGLNELGVAVQPITHPRRSK